MQVDVTDLTLGDTIDVAECEKLLECKSDSRDYPFMVMTLAKSIETELWRIGKQWTVCTVGGSVRVLTHAEAIAYNESTFDAGKRKMRLAHRRAMAIDVGGLTDELRSRHCDNLTKQGRMISAMRVRGPMKLDAVVKVTPSRG